MLLLLLWLWRSRNRRSQNLTWPTVYMLFQVKPTDFGVNKVVVSWPRFLNVREVFIMHLDAKINVGENSHNIIKVVLIMCYRVLFIFRFLEFHMPCLDLRLSDCGTDVDFTSSHCHHVMMPKKDGLVSFSPRNLLRWMTTWWVWIVNHLLPAVLRHGNDMKWRNNENNTRYMAFTMLKTQQLENKNGHFSFEVSNLMSFHRLVLRCYVRFFWSSMSPQGRSLNLLSIFMSWFVAICFLALCSRRFVITYATICNFTA